MTLKKFQIENYEAPTRVVPAEVSLRLLCDNNVPAHLRDVLAPYFAADKTSIPSIPGCEIIIESSPCILHGEQCYESFGAKFRYLEGTPEADLKEVRKILIDNGLTRVL